MKFLKASIFILLLSAMLASCKDSGTEKESKPGTLKSLKAGKKVSPAELLARSLDSLLQDSLLRNAGIGILMADLTAPQPRVVYTRNPDLSLVPASVIKLFTTAAALEIFGGSKSFSTALQYNGTISGRTLNGNLFIRGGGDPAFAYEKAFPRWVASVKELGIDTVNGDIFGDGSVFERYPVPLTWSWGELNTAYGAAASGLSIFSNVYEIRFKPTQKGPFSSGSGNITPELDEVTVYSQVAEGNITEEELYITGDPYGNRKYLRGFIPKGKTEISFFGSIPDPPLAAASEFARRLVRAGIVITGKAFNLSSLTDTCTDRKFSENRMNIGVVFSPSVTTLVSITNQESNNLFAEHLLKHIGVNKFHNGSEESGTLAVTQFWKSKGMDTGGLFLYDGCGISRYNALTARQLVFILDYMKRSPYFSVFYNSLPLAGVTGTLRNTFRDTPAESRLRAKTGTMSRVKSLAGYIRTGSSKTIAFSVLINNFNGSQDDMKHLLEEMFALVMKL